MYVDKPMVVIVDYGMGNLFSIERVVRFLGGIAVISSEPSAIVSAKLLILPGVGAFGDGMANLRKRKLIDPINEFVRNGKALLGICLGMQLFFTESEEFGCHPGLNLISGRVKKLTEVKSGSAYYKIPHVGWNKLEAPSFIKNSGDKIIENKDSSWKGTILENIPLGSFAYFVHSYVVTPDLPSTIISETVYANNVFCSTLRQGNVFGCQFHPEVSGEIGLKIIRNFLFHF